VSTPLLSFVILHSAPSPPTLFSTPTGVLTALLKNELLMSNGIGSLFEATGCGMILYVLTVNILRLCS